MVRLWDWLWSGRPISPAEPHSARPETEGAQSHPPMRPVPVASTAAVTPIRARRFGEFERQLVRPVGRSGDQAGFQQDREYEASPGVRDALAAIDAGAPIILVFGRAGTGKTRLIQYLRERPGSERQAVVAPTGVAALNARAQTIHSFFKLRPDGVLDPNQTEPSRNTGVLFQRLNRLIIDEISMVRADILDSIDIKLRRSRQDNRPFGGVQVVLVGDFLQLPPVVQQDDLPILHGLGYRSPFAFSARALSNEQFVPVELTRVYRQDDQAFIDTLATIRAGQGVDEALNFINSRCARPHRQGREPILLTPTRAAADRYNRDGMDRLPGASTLYEARIEGQLDIAKDRLPAPERLELKVGARVMAVKNDLGHRWVNGSLGTVTGLQRDHAMVRFDRDGNQYQVERAIWEKVRQVWDDEHKCIRSTRVAAYTQLPLTPAWAVTIHKAQGLSLDDVRVDLGHGAFASGHVYVALSRARTLDGLSLTRPIKAAEVKLDPMLRDLSTWLSSA